MKNWLRKMTSLLMCAAMLLGTSWGVMPVLAEEVVLEATPSEPQCTHEHVTYETYETEGNVRETSSDAIHMRTMNRYQKTICSGCEKVVDDQYLGSYEKEEAHTYSGIMCTVCGHGCMHENKNIDESGEEPTSEWTYYDEYTGHMRYVCVYEKWTCPDCGESGRTEKQEQRFELHAFKINDNLSHICKVCNGLHWHDFSGGGLCGICGELCQHTNRDTWTEGGVVEGSWQPKDAMQHVGQLGIYDCWRCRDCGKEVKTLTSTEETFGGHEYDENQTCTVCGFHNDCEHANKREWVNDNFVNPWTDDGNGRTHSTVVQRVHGWTCQNCQYFETVSTEEAARSGLHQYSDGVCVLCGAAETCTHPTLIHQEESYEGEWHDDGNGTTHSRSANRVLRALCGLCGANIEKVLEENVAQTENHKAGSDGVCYTCGATVGCTHANVYDGIEYCGVGDVVDNGDGTHTLRKRVVNVTLCKDCGNKQVTETDEILTVTEPHILDNDGKCINCPYQKPCEHLNTVGTDFIYFGDDYLPNEDGKTHCRYERVMARLTCKDCGATNIGTVQVMPTQKVTADHDYDYRGVCRYCGYIKPADEVCKHEHTKAIYYNENYHTLSKNATGHVMISDYMEEVLCADCGTQISLNVVKKDFISTDMHHFAHNGVCGECGYQKEKDVVNQACKHEHTVTETHTVRTLDVVKRDDNGHVINAVVADATYCEDCGEHLGDTNVRNETVTEGHGFGYDGKCRGCGYKNPCKHTHVHEENGVAYWNGIRVENDEMHSYVTFFVESIVCDDCGENLGDTLKNREPQRMNEYHDFDEDGICTVCGMSKPKETPAPTATPTPAPTSDSGNSTNNNTTNDNTFVPTPEPTATPEPTVSEATQQVFDAMDTLDRAAAQSQNVKIEIVGMEEIMPEEAFARVQQLPVKEQLMMMLAAADCGTVSKSIMASTEMTFSDSGDVLFKELNKAPATDQDRATVEARLTELFPVHVIMRDNVYYHVHVMTVKMTVDGVEQTYYFGLRLDEFGLWQMVELAETEVGEDTLVQK